MLRIAICDDEMSICNQLEKILEKLGKEFIEDIQADVFYSGEELCQYLSRDVYYDVIFLDIELKTMNGVEIGQIIRDELSNETTQIIYISGKQSYAMELFKVRPLDFIIKPFDLERIREVFSIALRMIQINKVDFHYKIGHTSYYMPMNRILYFESKDRKVILHSTKGTDVFYETLNNIYDKLKPFKFINIHKSYLVNYEHIIKQEYHQVTMSDNVVLPISQGNRKRIRALQLELARDNVWA